MSGDAARGPSGRDVRERVSVRMSTAPPTIPKQPMSAKTIRDVAERAGVSPITVSRVIRTPEMVAPRTRAAVQAAISALDYIPDTAAGNLSSRKSRTVGVILPSLHFEGHVRTVEGLSAELRRHGFDLLIADTSYSRTGKVDVLRTLLGLRPAGIVMISGAHSDAGRELLLRSHVPIVETWGIPTRPLDSVVGFSHAEVGRTLAEHLIERGYRRIAFVGGSDDGDTNGVERRKGFESAMRERDLDASRIVAVSGDSLTMEAGKRALELLLERYPDSDAVVFPTDRLAMGAMMQCRRRGIRVPEDLAVTGHGDFDFGEHLVPALTTTRIDARAIGARAAGLLLGRIEGKRVGVAERTLDVGFELVVRGSSDARLP